MSEEVKHNKRIWEIDFVRGVLIIGMLVDHFMFFLGSLLPNIFGNTTIPNWLMNTSGFAWDYWVHPAKVAIRYFGLLLFFTLVGISSRFSKNNLKRGLLTFGFGVAMALFLLVFSLASGINYYVLFPIIACLGACMLIYYGSKQLFVKAIKIKPENWKWWSLGFGIGVVITGFTINLCLATSPLRPGYFFLTGMGYYTPGPWTSDEPLNPAKIPLIILGVEKWGNDWLGLMPYLGFTFLGGFIGEHFYDQKKSLFFRRDEEKNLAFNDKANQITKPVNWLGNKTIWVYILHPFVLVPPLFILFWIATGQWPF